MYRNILLSIILSIVITLLVSSTILYFNFDNIALKQVYESDSNSLMQTSQEIRTITETATSLSFQIYRDFVISKLLFYDKPDIYDVTKAHAQLNIIRFAMPFIDSIYVYNGQIRSFLCQLQQFSKRYSNEIHPRRSKHGRYFGPFSELYSFSTSSQEHLIQCGTLNSISF